MVPCAAGHRRRILLHRRRGTTSGRRNPWSCRKSLAIPLSSALLPDPGWLVCLPALNWIRILPEIVPRTKDIFPSTNESSPRTHEISAGTVEFCPVRMSFQSVRKKILARRSVFDGRERHLIRRVFSQSHTGADSFSVWRDVVSVRFVRSVPHSGIMTWAQGSPGAMSQGPPCGSVGRPIVSAVS